MLPNADTEARLDRLLSSLALGTRKQTQILIRSGCVTVNGDAERHPERRVHRGDLLTVNSQVLDARLTRHVMLYKPCGLLTAARDPSQPTIFSLLPPLYAQCGCMPVGRLDKDTEGLLLLTTDGELAHRLLSPKRHVWKCYEARLDGALSDDDIQAFAEGIALNDFTALPARLEILDRDARSCEARVWVREGKYHQVRRMFAARGVNVEALKRLSFGSLTLDAQLCPGQFRELNEKEAQTLYDEANEVQTP